MACIIWGQNWTRHRILFYCDNLATVEIINKGRFKNSSIMKLTRKLTFHSALNNYVIHAKHIAGVDNSIVDAISHYQMARFRRLAQYADKKPMPCLLPTEVMME